MESGLLDEVWDRAAASGLPEDVGFLALAACEGQDALIAQLEGEAVQRPPRPDSLPAPPAAVAYLSGIAAQGFRGIGPVQELPLVPGPGLTLVVGRNGSGKSSFAEAAEITLTGGNYRWERRSAVWKQGWRNLHVSAAPWTEVRLAVEGARGGTVVRRTWGEGTDLLDAETVVQSHGRPQQALGDLGWTGPLETYRPFLSYSELGALLDDGPSKLYDALSAILNLDEVDRAVDRLRDERRARDQRGKQVREALTPLRTRLEQLDDQRAHVALRAVKGRRWDLTALEGVLSDQPTAPDSLLALLQSAAALAPPAGLETVAATVREALDAQRAVTGTDADRAARTAQILDEALALHESHGDADCPVCGRVDALDSSWSERARDQIEELRLLASEARAATAAIETALRDSQRALAPAPPELAAAETAGLDGAEVRGAWDVLIEEAPPRLPDRLADLAEHFEAVAPLLAAAIGRFRRQAQEELQRRQDVWRPLARELTGWVVAAAQAESAALQSAQLKQAEQWLGMVANHLRNERFQPVAAECKRVWELLRTASSVRLDQVVLGGTSTRRRVDVQVTVDGVDGAALGVMSQGELHALALALFVPRATLPQSPFGFLVIDDPVQSMDPSRVDGLARVLEEVAGTRQVVVFTHDDRLPEAVRRLRIPATVLGVTRRGQSVVEVRTELDPVARSLDDARALSASDGLPAKVAAQVVPGFCREALEAACAEAVRRRRISRGDAHTSVEQALLDAPKLMSKAALALFDDAGRAGEVLGRLRQFGRGSVEVFQACNKGAHGGYTGGLHALVTDAETLAGHLRRQH